MTFDSRRLRRMVVGRTPAPLLRRLRSLQRVRASRRYRTEQRSNPVRVSRDDVVGALRAAGLSSGDHVFVQSAMSPFGEIVGGAQSVLGAFDDVLGPDSLVSMPAFPFRGGMAESLGADPVFDVRSTPSAMGAVSERFRLEPGTERSLHPTHSVCARGPGAGELVSGHELSDTPFGERTPFARLVALGAHQVWFGADIDAFTLYHTFECLLGDRFPIKVFLDEPVTARCIDRRGHELEVSTKVHDPAVARQRIRSRARQEIRRELLEKGLMREIALGKSRVLVVRTPQMFDLLQAALARGLTIYDIETHFDG